MRIATNKMAVIMDGRAKPAPAGFIARVRAEAAADAAFQARCLDMALNRAIKAAKAAAWVGSK
jgi:hypothetical protein